MASRNRSTSQNETNGSSAQRRNSREAAAQYQSGKKFKVKCLGSQDISDYRSGDAVAADCMKKLRQDSARLKSTKTKATITLQFKGLAVFDEKSKTVSLNVPIGKVKYVCHDHQDISVFAVIIQIDRPGDSSGYRLHCYQADQKVAVSFVRSANELFTLIYKMMKAKRRARSQTSMEGGSSTQSFGRQDSSSSQGRGRSVSQDSTNSERRGSGQPVTFSIAGSEESSSNNTSIVDDTPVNLGFGIPPPPPSYKAAISRKNSEIYKVPEDMQVKPVVLAPPPKSASGNRLPNQRPRPVPQALPRPQTTPTLSAVPEASQVTPGVPNIPGPRPVPRPRGSLTGQTNTVQTQGQEASMTVQSSSQPQMSAGQGSSLNSLTQSQTEASFQPQQTEQANSPRVGTEQPPGQSNERQDVWDEWRSLEGQLQDLAQEVGVSLESQQSVSLESQESVTMDTNFPTNAFDGQVSFSSITSEDPFADDFFQSSFGAPSSHSATNSAQSDNFFASFPSTGEIVPVTALIGNAATETSPQVSSDPFLPSLPEISTTTDNFFASFPSTDETSSVTTSISDAVTDTTPQVQVLSLPADPFLSDVSTSTQATLPSSTPAHVSTDPFTVLSQPSFSTSSPIVYSTPARDPFSPTDSASDQLTSNPASTSIDAFSSDNFNDGFGTNFSSATAGSSLKSTTPSTVPAFEASFPEAKTSTPMIQPQVKTGKRDSLISAPPSNRRGSSQTGSRSRHRPRESLDGSSSVLPVIPVSPLTVAPVSQPDPFQALGTSSNSSAAAFSSETSAFASGFDSTNFSTDNDSTLQLSNPLYQSQTANSTFQQGPSTQAGIPAVSESTTLNNRLFSSTQPNFPVDPTWGGNNFQPQVNSTPQQLATYPEPNVQQSFPSQPQENFGYGSAQPFQPMPQPVAQPHLAYQFPPQEPSVPFNAPMQPVVNPPQGVFSPGSGDLFSGSASSGNVTDMSNNPFAGGFDSPPFAIHSSTPQSPGHRANNSYLYPQSSSSPLKPTTAAPSLEGPDPFANLLPLALSPSKEAKTPSKTEPQEPTAPKEASEPKPASRPTLNDLYNKKHSFQALGVKDPSVSSENGQPGNGNLETNQETKTNGHMRETDSFQDAFAVPTSEGSTKRQSFDDNFGEASNSTTSWIAF